MNCVATIVGGLFLAFPAIFPASATLIEKHVRRRKEKAGFSRVRRGREAAALDAAGAALGSLGLAAFAVVIWLLIERSPALVLARRLSGSSKPARSLLMLGFKIANVRRCNRNTGLELPEDHVLLWTVA